MIANKRGMNDLLKLALEIIVIVLAIYFTIWLISGNGFNILKAKTNEVIGKDSFNKEDENVRSWTSDSEGDCKMECIWDTKDNNAIYIWEETNRSKYYDSYLERNYTNIEGRCYCKY
ncbi:MAG: hypothetical protein ABFQ65_04670 [Nanoarchaeota archaeon]